MQCLSNIAIHAGGPSITITDTAFNFDAVLKSRVEDELFGLDEDMSLFGIEGLSPLTSPESSAPPSPSLQPPWPMREPPELEDVDILSPLTSPDPTPPPSPPALPPAPLFAETITTLLQDALSTSSYEVSGPISPSQEGPSTSERRRARKKAQSRKQREKKKREAAAQYGYHRLRKNTDLKYKQPAEALHCETDAAEAHVTATGFTAVDSRARSKKLYSLEELVGEGSKFGFRLQRWDGHTPIRILDKVGRFMGILAGHPDDPSWPALALGAAAAMERLRARCVVAKGKRVHRRGAFIALRCGVSHGGGQRRPKNLVNEPANEAVVQELNEMPVFQRIAGFASFMACWVPRLYEHYADRLGQLHQRSVEELHRNFKASVFTATTYNFGPRTACFRHHDFSNLPFGLCAITALGGYDPKRGGHMILWEYGLVIEFPPGSTILIPSACVAHLNVPVGKNETRYSVVQYSAGALFRWVENGFQKTHDFYNSLTKEQRETVDFLDASHWEYGLSLLPIFKA